MIPTVDINICCVVIRKTMFCIMQENIVKKNSPSREEASGTTEEALVKKDFSSREEVSRNTEGTPKEVTEKVGTNIGDLMGIKILSSIVFLCCTLLYFSYLSRIKSKSKCDFYCSSIIL